MNMKKIIAGGLAGGVTFFLLGWLVYGILLMDFMSANSRQSPAFRTQEDMIMWAMILGNLAYGFLLAYVINRGGDGTVMQGATTGAITGALITTGVDLMLHAQLDIWGKKVIAVDILASIVVTGIVGAVIAWVSSKMK